MLAMSVRLVRRTLGAPDRLGADPRGGDGGRRPSGLEDWFRKR